MRILRMAKIFVLFSSLALIWPQALNAQKAWRPDLSKLSGLVSAYFSIASRHPNLVQNDLNSGRDPLKLLARANHQLAKIKSIKRSSAHKPEFGVIERIFYSYSTEGELVYNDKALAELKVEISSALKYVVSHVPDIELDNIEKDLSSILAAKKDFKFSNYYKVAPFIYDANGKSLFGTMSGAEVHIQDAINNSRVQAFDGRYSDIFRLHLKPVISSMGVEVLNGELNKFINNFLGGRSFQIAITPISKVSADAVKKVDVELEQLPPLAALFRSEFGGDCSSSGDPYYALLKDVTVFLIRKNANHVPDGYVLMVNSEYNDKVVPYVITINGPRITGVDAKELLRAVAAYSGTDVVLIPEFGSNRNVINTEEIKSAMSEMAGESYWDAELPEVWDRVDGDYYKHSPLENAKVVRVDRHQIVRIEEGITPYQRVNIYDIPLVQRARLAASVKLNGVTREQKQQAFGITDAQMSAAEGLFIGKPSTASFFEASKELGMGFKDLAGLDRGRSIALARELYGQHRNIASQEQWDVFFNDVVEKTFDFFKFRVDLYMNGEADSDDVPGFWRLNYIPVEYWADKFGQFITSLDYLDKKLLLVFKEDITANPSVWAQLFVRYPTLWEMFEQPGAFYADAPLGIASHIMGADHSIEWDEKIQDFVISAFALQFERGPYKTDEERMTGAAGEYFVQCIEEVGARPDLSDLFYRILDDPSKGKELGISVTALRGMIDWIGQLDLDLFDPLDWGGSPDYDYREDVVPPDLPGLLPAAGEAGVLRTEAEVDVEDALVVQEPAPPVPVSGPESLLNEKVKGLYKMLLNANDLKSLMRIREQAVELAALELTDAERKVLDSFVSELEHKYNLLDYAARKGLVSADARQSLCVYAGVPSEGFPDDFITRKTIQRMYNEVESNGGVFSAETLSVVARDNVMDFMTGAAYDPSVVAFIELFRKVLMVEGDIYRNQRYYLDPKFEEVKGSLRDVRGIVKK